MTQYGCLRCGHEFEDSWSKDDDHEVTCPNCKSNSCRRQKPTKAEPPKK